jgi:hypothetical protein
MHHWHSGDPPRRYLCVLRWHPEHGPTIGPSAAFLPPRLMTRL